MPELKPPLGEVLDASHPAVAGVRVYWACNEEGGPPYEWCSGRPSSQTGSPTWVQGDYGPALGGFTGSDFYSVPTSSSGYPQWHAVMIRNTSLTNANGYPISTSNNATPLSYSGVRITDVNGTASWNIRDDASTVVVVSQSGLPTADGSAHVVMGVSYSASDHRLYFDGAEVSTSSSPVVGQTLANATLGCLQRITPSINYSGNVICGAIGAGSIPDPRLTADNWLSGAFDEIRGPSRLALYAPSVATTAGSISTTAGSAAAAAAGSIVVSASISTTAGSAAADGETTGSSSGSIDAALAASAWSSAATINVAAGSSSILSSHDAAAAGSSAGSSSADGGLALLGSSVVATAVVIGGAYDGDDVLSSIQAWWRVNGSSLTADSMLWHLEAPEDTRLPYCTIYIVAEEADLRTTSLHSAWRSRVQINCHAQTSAASRAMAQTIRSSLNGAPLTINGLAVWHVTPTSLIPPQTGEGRGPDDSDCWISGVEFEIPYNL